MTRSAADTARPSTATDAAIEELTPSVACCTDDCPSFVEEDTPDNALSAEEEVTGFAAVTTLSGENSEGPTVLGVTAWSPDFSATLDDAGSVTCFTLKRLGVV